MKNCAETEDFSQKQNILITMYHACFLSNEI